MSKTTHDLLASASDLLKKAVRRGLPLGKKSVTVTFDDDVARAVGIAIDSIIGKPADRVTPVDACRNWAGMCDTVCDACRDTYLSDVKQRRAKFDAECDDEGFNLVQIHNETGSVIETLVPVPELSLPWTSTHHPFPGMGFSIRDAFGRHRALVPNSIVADAIIAAVSAYASESLEPSRMKARNKADAIMAQGDFNQLVGWESPEEHELEQAAFRMANNPELPEEARKLIADLWRQYCFAAAPAAKHPNEDPILSAYAEAAAAPSV